MIRHDTSASRGFYDATDSGRGYDSDPELDYSGVRRRRKTKSFFQKSKYSVHVEYPTQPGYGVNRGPKAAARGLISRNREGKFVLDETDDNIAGDEGGFEIQLPPNRFRTRSVAIVAGYSPERLYSNMPAGAFVVESGMYKVGADRGTDWERPEPIYWKQVMTADMTSYTSRMLLIYNT